MLWLFFIMSLFLLDLYYACVEYVIGTQARQPKYLLESWFTFGTTKIDEKTCKICLKKVHILGHLFLGHDRVKRKWATEKTELLMPDM